MTCLISIILWYLDGILCPLLSNFLCLWQRFQNMNLFVIIVSLSIKNTIFFKCLLFLFGLLRFYLLINFLHNEFFVKIWNAFLFPRTLYCNFRIQNPECLKLPFNSNFIAVCRANRSFYIIMHFLCNTIFVIFAILFQFDGLIFQV